MNWKGAVFVDLEKEFDRVPHELIWYSLRDHHVPEPLIDVVRTLYTDAHSQVQTTVGKSKPFPIQVGVHQGSALSALIFILVMDAITRDLHTEPPWTLLYADDVMLTTKTKAELQDLLTIWHVRFLEILEKIQRFFIVF
ncbi:unnamed protein product [Caenorhabditis auriculariae]|uniref:Reverse transcriptase domain-containing protein n=1 Tax=Caenorhabditis auriculariae TaxID=2777116 RepID=A0A8S1H5C9_9PELO|nr:unnamed protein product [Caenorhabditis auriculariae]